MKTEIIISLADLIERGGIHYRVPGASPKEVITEALGLLPADTGLDSSGLLREILEREALMSTGIGRGIALPHPRNPPLGETGKPLVALAFPALPLDWNTPDGSKVDTVFLIVSSSAKQHLGALSKITFLCQQEKFIKLIKKQASKKAIIAAIRKAETAWAKAE